MTFEILTPTDATLTSVTPRTERHGEDDVFAISLGLRVTGPNTLLDLLAPGLRESLYMAVEGQEQLPGVEPSTPLLHCKLVDMISLGASFEGWTIAIDHGIDESDPITLGGAKVDKFKVTPHEGGSVDIAFRVGSNDIDAAEAGLLCSHLAQVISFTLRAPEIKKAEPVIDGTGADFKREHPDAGDLFVAQHGGGDDGPDESGDEEDGRGHPDAGEAEQDELEAGMRDSLAEAGLKPKRGGRKVVGVH